MSGCIEPFLADPKKSLTSLEFAKLILFVCISGTRDVKEDGGVIGSVINDGDDTFALAVDPRPYKNTADLIKTAVAATDCLILARPGLNQNPLTQEDIGELANLVHHWDISAICQKLAVEPIRPFFDREIEKMERLGSKKPIQKKEPLTSPSQPLQTSEVKQGNMVHKEQVLLFGFVDPELDDLTAAPASPLSPLPLRGRKKIHKVEGKRHLSKPTSIFPQGQVQKSAWTPPSVTCTQGQLHRINESHNFFNIDERSTILSEKQVQACQLRMERAKSFILAKHANRERFSPLELVSAIDPFFQIYSEAFEALPKNGPKKACEFVGRFPLRELGPRLRLPAQEVEATADKMLTALKERLPWIYETSSPKQEGIASIAKFWVQRRFTAQLPTAAPRS